MLQVLFVGMTLGMMRTVVPALAEAEFGVARGSFMMLVAFVLAFGVVKAVMNFVAERLCRRPVLKLGWVLEVILYFAPSWSWIVLATVLLGINQGLTWSMTQTTKLDLAGPEQRGRVIGLNECAGYAGVAIAGVAGIGNRHLSLLARSGLRGWRRRPRHRCHADRRGRGGILVRGCRHDALGHCLGNLGSGNVPTRGRIN